MFLNKKLASLNFIILYWFLCKFCFILNIFHAYQILFLNLMLFKVTMHCKFGNVVLAWSFKGSDNKISEEGGREGFLWGVALKTNYHLGGTEKTLGASKINFSFNIFTIILYIDSWYMRRMLEKKLCRLLWKGMLKKE